MEPQRVEEGFRELEEAGLLAYDQEEEMVLLTDFLRTNPLDNVNVQDVYKRQVFYCRVREHRLGAAARRQSLSRRSPTAPFAQGSRLCLSASSLPSAAAQYGRPDTGPHRMKGREALRCV